MTPRDSAAPFIDFPAKQRSKQAKVHFYILVMGVEGKLEGPYYTFPALCFFVQDMSSLELVGF